MDTGRGRGEGWALVLKQLYAGQQISTPETALAGVSRSQCFYISCLTDIPILVRDGRVVAQEVGEALLWSSGTCVYLRTFPRPWFSALSVLYPTEALENASKFSICSRNHGPQLPVKCLSFGCSLWLGLGCCVIGGKGLAPELMARSHWPGHICAAEIALLTAGLSCEEVVGVVQKHAEDKLIEQCAVVLKLASFSTFI